MVPSSARQVCTGSEDALSLPQSGQALLIANEQGLSGYDLRSESQTILEVEPQGRLARAVACILRRLRPDQLTEG
jgi:hypothetical protein